MTDPDLHRRIKAAEAFKRVAANLYHGNESLDEIEQILQQLNEESRFKFLTCYRSPDQTNHIVYRYGGNPFLTDTTQQWRAIEHFHRPGHKIIFNPQCEKMRKELLDSNYITISNLGFPVEYLSYRYEYLGHRRDNLLCRARCYEALQTMLKQLPQDKRLSALLVNEREDSDYVSKLIKKAPEILSTQDLIRILQYKTHNGKAIILENDNCLGHHIDGFVGYLAQYKHPICQLVRYILSHIPKSERLHRLRILEFSGYTLLDIALSSYSACTLESILENLTCIEKIEYLGSALHDAVIFGMNRSLQLNMFPDPGKIKFALAHLYCCSNTHNSLALTILKSLDEQSKLELLQRREGKLEDTPLHLAEDGTSFKLMLESIPEESRLSILSEQNANNDTILHNYPNHLSLLLPPNLSVPGLDSLLNIQNSRGQTIIHRLIQFQSQPGSWLIGSPLDSILGALRDQSTQSTIQFLTLQDSEGCTVFHLLAKRVPELLKALDLVFDGDIHTILSLKNSLDCTVLHLLDYSDLHFVQAAVERIPDVHQKISIFTQQDRTGLTPMHIMAKQGHYKGLNMIFQLFEKENRYKLVQDENHEGQSLLHMAVIAKQESIIKLTLDQLEPNRKLNLLTITDKRGKTAMHLAIAKDLKSAIKYMCQAIGRKEMLKLLGNDFSEEELSNFEVLIGNDDAAQIKQWLQQKIDSSSKRHLVSAVIGCTARSHVLNEVINDLDEEELGDIERMISNSISSQIQAGKYDNTR